jgi:sugar fermentation stimulation protein A
MGARRLPDLRYPGGATRVRFLERPNRYLAWVEDAEGRRFEAHVPNPGRLRELLPPGGTYGHVVPAPRRGQAAGASGRPPRRTHWTLVNVEYPAHPSTLVSIDTRAAAPLVARALAWGLLAPLRSWGQWRSEVAWGHHRFDHAVPAEGAARPQALLEVKSSNLREGDQALFPDAPTERGASHVRALADFARRGGRAALLFVVQRDDVTSVAPYGAMDPAFAHAVERARAAGVVTLARTLHVRPDGASWGDPLPVRAPRWGPGRDLGPPRALYRRAGPREGLL